MILDRHPDARSLKVQHRELRAIGYWRVPLSAKRVALYEALIAGNGRATIDGVGVSACPDPDVHREALAALHAEDKQPDPRDFVDEIWDPVIRDRVVAYLINAPRAAAWMGYSHCRMCPDNPINGTTCRSDGVFIWPEGFAHYLTAHNVRPPVDFVDHVLSHLESP